MSKNEKEVKKKVQLNLDGLKTGMVIKDLHNEDIEIDDDLIEQMKAFEKDTKKSAIWRNRITGSFLLYKWIKKYPEEKKVKEVIEEELEEVIEEQVKNEEDELLDAMEDYRMKFNVKKVNTSSKKFKAFYEKWKQSE